MYPDEVKEETRTRPHRTRPNAGRFPSLAAELRLSIQDARSWEDLETLSTRIDRTFQSGEVDIDTAEELADLVQEMARIVPEVAPGGQVVWAEDLLEPGKGEGCPCCGETAWWNEGGKKRCGVCHPNPAWKTENRSAA